MYREFVLAGVRRNRAANVTVMVGAFVAATILAFVCSLFANLWIDTTARIIRDEGNWHGRLTGIVTDADVRALRARSTVADVHAGPPGPEGTRTVELTFTDPGVTFDELPRIAEDLGVPAVGLAYHTRLLAQHFVFDPDDRTPPLLARFFVGVLGLVAVAMVFVITHAFAVSSGARTRQFGMLASIGATPRQVRRVLLLEAMVLCLLPVLVGTAAGVGASAAFVRFAGTITAATGGEVARFHDHPAVWAISMAVTLATVLTAAWLPARRLSRRPLLQSLRGSDPTRVPRPAKHSLLGRIFGIEGELASASLRSRRAALRTSTVSLTLSFLAFSLFASFWTLSAISTQHSYFDRYREAWDLQVTVDLSDPARVEEVSALPGVRDVVAYQRADADVVLPESSLSDDVERLGGLGAIAGRSAAYTPSGWVAPVTLLVLDEASFVKYAQRHGDVPQTSEASAIVVNRIWDRGHSSFRDRTWVPYLSDGPHVLTLATPDGTPTRTRIPVTALSSTPPNLRESADDFGLLVVVPTGLWQELAEQPALGEPSTFVRILTEDGALDSVEAAVSDLYGGSAIVENRVRDEISDAEIRRGYMLVVGALCALLALVGIANVLAQTWGQAKQRRREFARYLSVGVGPSGLRRLLAVEALVLAGRPLLIAVPVTGAFVLFAVDASELSLTEFWPAVPWAALVGFAAAIVGCVVLGQALAARDLNRTDLAEMLQSELLL
ncbi:MAG TPA: ABC transporter permease [Propionibacterium sp.]|nr:ABC transporter permease [Propionibacterium sp.]